MDYLNYWSLIDKPFTASNVAFFMGGPQREAFAGLSYFVTNRLATAALVGASGCGMTTMLQHVHSLRGFNDNAAEVISSCGDHETRDCAQRALFQALGYRNLFGDLASHIDSAIESSAKQGLQTVWLVDQCSVETAQLARSLACRHKSFSVVVGTTTGEYVRKIVEFGRCAMRIDLAPLSIEESIQYVHHCMEHAGDAVSVFPDVTIVRMHEISGGILAELSRLAESSLALAANHRLQEIPPAIVEAIDEQVSWAA